MLRVVVDTNQFVSSVIVPHGLPRRLIDAWKQRQFLLLSSPAMIAEVSRVLRYPRIQSKYGIDEADIAALVTLIEADAMVLPGTTEVAAVEDDPDDEMFLACAIEGKADFIVSGDPHLLSLATFRGIPIVTVRDFFGYLSLNQT